MKKLFTQEERRESNVRGRGKLQLDVTKINYVHNIVFNFYPLGPGETERLAWGECIKAIDSDGRKLNRDHRKTQH